MHGQPRMQRLLAATLAMAATLGLAATAQAGDNTRFADHYTSVVVSYADLDLTSAAGNKTLYARLTNAVDRACGSSPPLQELWRRTAYNECYDGALNRAVNAIGSRELHALHATVSNKNVG